MTERKTIEEISELKSKAQTPVRVWLIGIQNRGGRREKRRRGSRGVGRGKDPPGVYIGERRVQGSQRKKEMRWVVGRRV
jgi:hypothetical protein